MRAAWFAAASLLATAFATMPAQACRMYQPLDMDDIQYADAVIVGRLSHYEIIPDEFARERRERILQNQPDMPGDMRVRLEGQTSFIGDYARFRITVRETLHGATPRVVTVRWDNSTFEAPASLAPGDYLVAIDTQEGETVVLQAVCSSPFLFPANSDEAREARARLR